MYPMAQFPPAALAACLGAVPQGRWEGLKTSHRARCPVCGETM